MGREVVQWAYRAPLDRDARVLIWIFLSLGRYCHKLIGHGLPRLYVAVLEHNTGVAEDEVDGARDVAVAVELAVGVRVQGVLKGVERAPVVDRLVGPGTEGYGLVLCSPGCVLERYVPSDESSSGNCCN